MTRTADYPRISAHVSAAATAGRTTPEEVLSRVRSAHVARARHILYWLMRYDGLSFPCIGALLERDHTTVMHGVERVDADPELLRIAWSLVPREAAA